MLKELLTQLNPAFDHRNRIGIMAVLVGEGWVEYNTLRQLLCLTDGNLASHLRALEDAGYIEIRKEFVGRKTRTTYSSTKEGGQAFQLHLDALEALVKAGRND